VNISGLERVQMPSLGRWLGDIIIIFFVDNFFTIFIENAVKIKSCTLNTI
jgi:hypothetical protein